MSLICNIFIFVSFRDPNAPPPKEPLHQGSPTSEEKKPKGKGKGKGNSIKMVCFYLVQKNFVVSRE